MNILIYGTGGAARKFYRSSVDLNKVKILAFVDKSINEDNQSIDGYEVIIREQIEKYNYDYIIIASTFTDIYIKLLEDYNISEYRLIPIYYPGKNPLLEKLILNEITKQNAKLALLEVKTSNDIEQQNLDKICLNDVYFRDKVLCKVCKSLQNTDFDEVFMIGRPNPIIAKLFTMMIEKPVHILHSIEDSFQMSVTNPEQMENLILWEKLLENEMKYSRKTILEQFENLDDISYRFGFLDDILEQDMNKISFAYLETSSILTFKNILSNINNRVNSGGYIFLYNPNLTQEESLNNDEIARLMKSEYEHFVQLPLISDDFGMLWYKC